MKYVCCLFGIVVFSISAQAIDFNRDWNKKSSPSPSLSLCLSALFDHHQLTTTVERAMRLSLNSGPYGVVTAKQHMIDIRKMFPTFDIRFDYFERFFRQHGIPYYLVAHNGAYPQSMRIVLPSADGSESSEKNYYLWIGVNEQEAEVVKAELGLSGEENIRRLHETGVLHYRNGTHH